MKTPLAFAAITLALCVAPAYAQDGNRTVYSHIISYDDIDLASKEGKRSFDHRARIAVHSVCGGASDADLASANAVRTCRHSLMQRIAAIAAERQVASAR